MPAARGSNSLAQLCPMPLCPVLLGGVQEEGQEGPQEDLQSPQGRRGIQEVLRRSTGEEEEENGLENSSHMTK